MNIFLTGEINSGKSTVLNTFLEEYKGSAAGYRTVRVKTELDNFYGVYLLDVNDTNSNYSLNNKAGDCFEDKSLICYENVFETLGVELLSNNENADIIIMDEVGVLEKNCELFKGKIFECLDSDVDVLGVIKPKDRPFLNSIREREDVNVIEVSFENSQDVLDRLRRLFVNNI